MWVRSGRERTNMARMITEAARPTERDVAGHAPIPTIRWLDGSTIASPLSIARPVRRVSSDASPVGASTLLLGLSAALDLTEGQLPGHALRTTYLAMRVADDLGLSTTDRGYLFNASILKDAGCSSNSAAITRVFGTDDIELKRRQSTIEGSMLAYAAFTIRNLPPSESIPVRIRRLIAIGIRGSQERRHVEQLRCERGASIARKAGFSDEVGRAIHDIHERWDGSGEPRGLRGPQIDPLARLISACAALDVFNSTAGRSAAVDVLARRRGSWYDPDIVDTILIAASRGLLDDLEAPDLLARTTALEPEQPLSIPGTGDVDTISSAFADIIDAKSPYTASHSHRVAEIAESIALSMGLPDSDVIDIRRAALLHDLGKLGVPNIILDKPGRLDDAEMEVIRRHPELSYRILAGIPTMSRVAELAACHHERLDGRGYFRGLAAEELATGARIVAVADVFEALIAERPYRSAMPTEQALSILRAESGDHLAADVVEALELLLN